MSKILLIDDDVMMRLTLARVLRGAGHEVTQAEDGERGLAMYRAAPAEVAIIDLFMPNKNGLEVIAELRKETARPVIIAISGHPGMLRVLREKNGLEGVRHIEKPFEPEALLALVTEELDWVRAGTEARSLQ